MKLYTEEQVRKAIKLADECRYVDTSVENGIISVLTPIKLPSDEEIERELESHTHMTLELGSGFIAGANYVINKIQGGNK